MAKKKSRPRRMPQRTCVGCREIDPKRSMIRIVRTPGSVTVDPTGKLNGRGAYLHDKKSCWELGMKGSLEQALKTKLTEQDRETLYAFMNGLPDEETNRKEHDGG